jgi:hypothetical protein
LPCLWWGEAEVFRDAQRQLYRRISSLFINEHGWNAWPELQGNRVQIVSGWRSPALAAFIEQTVIAQVIAGIRDRDGQDNPLQGFMLVFCRNRAITLDCIGDFQEAPRLTIFSDCCEQPKRKSARASPCPDASHVKYWLHLWQDNFARKGRPPFGIARNLAIGKRDASFDKIGWRDSHG